MRLINSDEVHLLAVGQNMVAAGTMVTLALGSLVIYRIGHNVNVSPTT